MNSGDSGPVSRCPICRRETDPAIRPFCSKRCADIDLHRWLSGAYAVPADQLAGDEAGDVENVEQQEKSPD